MKSIAGFSLIELMVALLVLGVAVSMAAPSFGKLISQFRVESASKQLRSALQLARSEAVKRNQPVSLCRANTALNACDDTASWTDGWLMAIGSDVLKVGGGDNSVETEVSVDKITFLGSGVAKEAAEIVIESGVHQKTLCVLRGGHVQEAESC